LIPLVYDELRRLARHYLESEKNRDVLQSTALVHEAYLRLVDHSPSGIEGRAQFLGIAARLMRQILVDHARARRAAKRDAGCSITLDESVLMPKTTSVDVVALDDALNELSRLDAKQARIVELRFFAGLSIEDTSRVLDIAPVTVKRNWANARLWLQRELRRGA
jgi:RNA polymerase sigma factor (TIGR02999 family)